MNSLGIRTDRDILGDHPEARTGFGGASVQARLAGKLVLELIQIEHQESMLRAALKRAVPIGARRGLERAFAIHGLEELAL